MISAGLVLVATSVIGNSYLARLLDLAQQQQVFCLRILVIATSFAHCCDGAHSCGVFSCVAVVVAGLRTVRDIVY